MDKSHRQQGSKATWGHLIQSHAAGSRYIGNQYQNSGQELQKGPVNAFHLPDQLVQQNHRRVKGSGPQSEENSNKILSSSGFFAKSGNQYQPDCGHEKAENLLAGEPLPKQEGAGGSDNDRGEIIA